MEETSPIHFNKEDRLRSVIKLAYYTYRAHYVQWEELPAGEGYTDIVYLPKQDSGWPALVVELKRNKSTEGAIDQIKRKKYPETLKNYCSKILLVGINYNKDAPAGERNHTCVIQTFDPVNYEYHEGSVISDLPKHPGHQGQQSQHSNSSLPGQQSRSSNSSLPGQQSQHSNSSLPGQQSQLSNSSLPGQQPQPSNSSLPGQLSPPKRQNREMIHDQILKVLNEYGSLSMNKIAVRMGYVRLTNTLRDVVGKMVETGEVWYMYPDKPRSRNQKICLTNSNCSEPR